MILAAILSAIAVLPSDRMALADRLFNRGEYESARAEYSALAGAEGIEKGELEYRLGECCRALGRNGDARSHYLAAAAEKTSRHADRARLNAALCGGADEMKAELKVLDTGAVDPAVRAAACYHLGAATTNAELLTRSLECEPKGPYSQYALFARAAIWVKSESQDLRSKAVGDLLTIAFGGDRKLGDEALYLAAVEGYAAGRYSQAGTMLRRYAKNFPDGAHAKEALRLRAWSDYLSSKYAECSRLCAENDGEDFVYLSAACAYQLGETERARGLFAKYLETHPEGRYRANCELPVSRLEFDEARARNDAAAMLSSAKRAYELSSLATDAFRLAWCHENAGRGDEACAVYDAVAAKAPGGADAAEALYRKAMVAIRAGKWSRAELALAEAMKAGDAFKHLDEARYWRGMCAIGLGHDAEGEAMLKEALQGTLSLDQSREARLALADIAYKAGRKGEAKAAYARLVCEGALDRMSAQKMLFTGKFLLSEPSGAEALDEAKLCAKAIWAAAKTDDWRQQAKFLEGAAEEKGGHFAAAIAAYRAGLSLKVRTESAPAASMALGSLERRAGEWKSADATLREAIELNRNDPAARCAVYLELAENALGAGDVHSARAYATVVTTLFDDAKAAARAEKLLKEHPEP